MVVTTLLLFPSRLPQAFLVTDGPLPNKHQSTSSTRLGSSHRAIPIQDFSLKSIKTQANIVSLRLCTKDRNSHDFPVIERPLFPCLVCRKEEITDWATFNSKKSSKPERQDGPEVWVVIYFYYNPWKYHHACSCCVHIMPQQNPP